MYYQQYFATIQKDAWLNPGSCGPRRFHQEITMMAAEATGGALRVEKISIPQEVQ